MAGRRARPYHHGDLRRAIIDASLALVGEGGVSALSLREAARRAKVSPAAPFHHFPTRRDLLAAIAEEGFSKLAASMEQAMQAAGDDPAARFEASGLGYVRFALAHPAHFRVMFVSELRDRTGFPQLAEAGGRAWGVLVSQVTILQKIGRAPTGPIEPLVITAWSAVHGLATLLLDGPLAADLIRAPPETLARMVTSTLRAGFAAVATHDGPGANRGARRASGR
jgi:AcrR family transcriptional regulator